jgi:hypothetical protein
MRTTSAASIWGPGLAVLYVELDRLDEARAEFERLAARDFDDLSRDGRWATCLAYLAEVCTALKDARRAVMLYRLLLPYADRALALGGGFSAAAPADVISGCSPPPCPIGRLRNAISRRPWR